MHHWPRVCSGCCDPWCPPRRRAPSCCCASCLATPCCSRRLGWCAAGASLLPGPRLSASAGDDGVREAERWLQTALDGRRCRNGTLAPDAPLLCDPGQEDTALAHLQDYLSWWVEWGRNCFAGCWQQRGEDAQMLRRLPCSEVFAAQIIRRWPGKAWTRGGGRLLQGRHKDLCGVLGK